MSEKRKIIDLQMPIGFSLPFEGKFHEVGLQSIAYAQDTHDSNDIAFAVWVAIANTIGLMKEEQSVFDNADKMSLEEFSEHIKEFNALFLLVHDYNNRFEIEKFSTERKRMSYLSKLFSNCPWMVDNDNKFILKPSETF